MKIKLSRKAWLLIVIFTIVETGILTLWIYVLHNPIAAVVILFVGLLVEHTLATIAGKV